MLYFNLYAFLCMIMMNLLDQMIFNKKKEDRKNKKEIKEMTEIK